MKWIFFLLLFLALPLLAQESIDGTIQTIEEQFPNTVRFSDGIESLSFSNNKITTATSTISMYADMPTFAIEKDGTIVFDDVSVTGEIVQDKSGLFVADGSFSAGGKTIKGAFLLTRVGDSVQISGKDILLENGITLNEGSLIIKDNQFQIQDATINNVLIQSREPIFLHFTRQQSGISLTPTSISATPSTDVIMNFHKGNPYFNIDASYGTGEYTTGDSLSLTTHEGGSFLAVKEPGQVTKVSISGHEGKQVTLINGGTTLTFNGNGKVTTQYGKAGVPMVITHKNSDGKNWLATDGREYHYTFNEAGEMTVTDAKNIYEDGSYACV